MKCSTQTTNTICFTRTVKYMQVAAVQCYHKSKPGSFIHTYLYPLYIYCGLPNPNLQDSICTYGLLFIQLPNLHRPFFSSKTFLVFPSCFTQVLSIDRFVAIIDFLAFLKGRQDILDISPVRDLCCVGGLLMLNFILLIQFTSTASSFFLQFRNIKAFKHFFTSFDSVFFIRCQSVFNYNRT